MPSDVTRWTLIRGAAAGVAADREAFARRYGRLIHASLAARWRGTALAGEVEDGVQEAFLECFKDGGALERVDPDRGTGFRAFLNGVVRHVALRRERARARRRDRPAGTGPELDGLPSRDEPLSELFDREWGRTVVREAARRQRSLARKKGERALRRHRLLQLRYGEGLPIRAIAGRWQADADFLHGQLRQARDEFRQALQETIREFNGGGPESVDAECRRLMQLFS